MWGGGAVKWFYSTVLGADEKGNMPLFGRYNPMSYLPPMMVMDYTITKEYEALDKAWQTGNPWDFWDYTFLTIPGYKNLKNMWGGGNLQWCLETLFGIDENGNMSLGNTLINVVSLIPIARVVSWGGKAIKSGGILEKLGIQGLNLGDNIIVNEFSKFTGWLGKQIDFKSPENLKNGLSFVTNLTNPNPFGPILDLAGYAAKRINPESIIAKAATAFNTFELKRGVMELATTLVGPDPVKKISDQWQKAYDFGVRIVQDTKTALQAGHNYVKAKATQGYNYVKAKATQGYNYVKAKATQGYNYVKAKA
ncbi:MAG: hypothetical protein HZC47_00030, partial [Methanobacterium sp.]|uniref:hypothetical protein n=1 Tax=Methanobacterium sp. TaxID=2164 RepID=UPI003D65BF13|nr:hypothetical protein [Methanobacterium sp.]